MKSAKGETKPLLSISKREERESTVSDEDIDDEIWAHEHNMDNIGKVSLSLSLSLSLHPLTLSIVPRQFLQLCSDH